jgi:DNA mismatch repair protein MutS2
MDEHSLRILEWPALLEALSRETLSLLGQEKALQLTPAADIKRVKEYCSQTKALWDLRLKKGSLPLGGIKDLRPILRRARIRGALLSPQELLEVAQTLVVARRVKAFYHNLKTPYPALDPFLALLLPLPDLEAKINDAISSDGEVKDEASASLKTLRRGLLRMREDIREGLERYLSLPQYQPMLQERFITQREGRYVIPVKANYKGHIRGLIQGQSQSGVTFFLEPEEVVEKNNRLKELQSEEETEVRRILGVLSEEVHAKISFLWKTLEILGDLDLLSAKLELGEKLSGALVAVEEKGSYRVLSARHPLLIMLLGPERVVPLDLKLDKETSALIITGPNTGGKTVVLKTLGLLSLMAQAGIPLPASPDSTLPFFGEVLADIGDEQSLQQSLSTFSSHMTQIRRILERVDEQSLVLLDELGAGTDPAEGSALAMAILEYLMARGAKTFATTHHSALKVFAYTTAGAQNASVLFDEETLGPLYRLVLGASGQSNALAIAKGLGLPDSLLEAAQRFLEERKTSVDHILSHLEEDQRQISEERRLWEEESAQAQKLRREVEASLKAFKEEAAQAKNKLGEESKRLLAQAHHEVKELLKSLRQAEDKKKESEKALWRLKEIEQGMEKHYNTLTPSFGHPSPSGRGEGGEGYNIQPGQKVKIISLNQKGEVLRVMGEEAEVLVGKARVVLPLSNLKPLEPGAKTEGKEKISLRLEDKEGVKELMLLGLTVEEAWTKVDKFLDDAFLLGLLEVRLIHGKGTGALRQGLHNLLKDHPLVESFRLGDRHEGGAGATVVMLRE